MTDTETTLTFTKVSPYNGKPQHQALRAAMRRAEDARMVSGDRPIYHSRLSYSIDSNGMGWDCRTARLILTTNPRGDVGKQQVDLATIRGALIAAGWEIHKQGDGDGWVRFELSGPGYRAFVKKHKEAVAESQRITRERESAKERERNEIAELLHAYGITSVRFPYNYSNDVSLSPEQLRSIIEQARKTA